MLALLFSALLLITPPDTLAPQPDSSGRADTLRLSKAVTKLAVNLDFRDSFLERQHVNVWGVNAGIEFGEKRHQLTLGYYWLSYATYLQLINWRRDAARRINLDYYTRTDLWFMNIQYWWNLTNNRHWMVSFPVELGGGVAYALPQSLGPDQPIDRTHRSFFVPVQVGAYAQWKATRWAGLSIQGGYRRAIFQTDINQHFNGVYYSVGVSVFPALVTDMWRFLRKGDRISPVKAPQPRTGSQYE
ncbi:hypothetical protein J2I47_03750 [Fibrella sp. HMF5335]|uniref:DUF3575 domain-containing protein n=1 Tax=Fibrella rubiginis TaxID=2817060 RepID=A0A939GEA9_9BACT|nr:hypothetical protein [Fibrella rubiginis]MBO0935654.1 hypothetical protein [Fibrella rubiginis]